MVFRPAAVCGVVACESESRHVWRALQVVGWLWVVILCNQVIDSTGGSGGGKDAE